MKTDVYACGYCGKEYPTIPERTACEQRCLKKQEEEKIKLEKEAAGHEQKALEEECQKLKSEYLNKFDQYCSKYGTPPPCAFFVDHKSDDAAFPLVSQLNQLVKEMFS